MPTLPKLFTPLKLRDIELSNRVVVSPMCMYSCQDGLANEFHKVHLGQFALGSAGLILAEATAVLPEGRISPEDLGLWNDQQIAPLKQITDFVHQFQGRIGIQLAHAGRKASTYAPGRGRGAIAETSGGWPVYGPDHNAYRDSYAQPHAMTSSQIQDVIDAFALATRRSLQAGFDTVEIHAAHGYLLHQFMSPLSNSRNDNYGGRFENRVRLLLEVVRACRAEWPEHLPLLVRISATDWAEGGWNLDESTQLARLLSQEGVDLLDVSSGALTPQQKITVKPGYQVPFAAHIKTQVPELTIMVVGLIDNAQQAETILQENQADCVALARAFLRNPHWTQQAASELGLTPDAPEQYVRAGWPI